VGLILPTGIGEFDDPFFLRLLSAIGPALADAGLDLLVSAAPPGEPELRAYRHMVESRRVDGFLLARTRAHDPRVAYLQQAGVSFVAHGRSQTAHPFAYVDTDGMAAMAEATRRLIGFGHRRIGFISASGGLNFAAHREAGWRDVMQRSGLACDLFGADEPDEAGGFRATHSLLASARDVSALITATDRMAAGSLHALAETGLRAGRDISLIGFDNHRFTAHTDPPLTTISQPIEQAGERMVAMLLSLFAGGDPSELHEILPATLIPRDSDGPIITQAASTSRIPQA
jgi:LacI family transcriptional regulator